jgi:ferritin-like protein
MSSATLESGLSETALDVHRALASLQEELEAVDYYNQRADRTQDGAIRSIVEHNRDEEVEHAAMLLEWLRRRLPAFDEALKTYLFTSAEITSIEESATGGGSAGPAPDGSLGIGALRD